LKLIKNTAEFTGTLNTKSPDMYKFRQIQWIQWNTMNTMKYNEYNEVQWSTMKYIEVQWSPDFALLGN